MWLITVYKAQTGLHTKRLLYTSVHILHIRIYMWRTLYIHKEFPLTNGTSIPCGHNNSEGVVMFCECFQSDSNRISLSDDRVCGWVEPHRNYRFKNEEQWNTCTTVKSQINYIMQFSHVSCRKLLLHNRIGTSRHNTDLGVHDQLGCPRIQGRLIPLVRRLTTTNHNVGLNSTAHPEAPPHL